MSEGLSANELRSLRKQYGFVDAAIEARPDLADQLRDAQRRAQRFAEYAQALQRMVPNLRMPAFPAPEAIPSPVEHEIGIVAAGVAAALDHEPEPPATLRRGVKPTDVPQTTKRKVAALRLAGGSYAEIQRQTGLSRTITKRLVDDIDAVLGKIRAGRY